MSPERSYPPETTHAWLRLATALVLGTIGGVAMWWLLCHGSPRLATA
jgi:hypothetical protein